MAIFKLEKIKVNDILAIKDMEIGTNKVTCITGQSGSGKSTLLRLLNRLDDPDEGKIYFDQKPIHAINPLLLRSQVVMVPQTPVIFDGTIRDNLQIGCTFSRIKPVDDQRLKKNARKVKSG
ncbi:ATP-binding cassette domain-containing protein [Virgibacillus halophilus]|uniref:ATP-binding cassette domain-containing protein n=1 Tax=Tigheibacillus halophilus TaxID=361280 RepID=A0ABU5CDP4_9BACI|nr:ATP-binding cassette domain-containing protein [Virgibacillus halophilus]